LAADVDAKNVWVTPYVISETFILEGNQWNETFIVTLRRVRVTIVAEEKQWVLHRLSVCVWMSWNFVSVPGKVATTRKEDGRKQNTKTSASI